MRETFITALLSIFSRMSLANAQRIGGWIGRIMYRFPNKERHIAATNLRLCLANKTDSELDDLLKATLIENSKIMAEMPGILSGRFEHWVSKVLPGVGTDLFEAALAQGKGVIAIGPHQGNWEMGLQHLSTLSQVTSPYRAPKMAFLDEWVKSGRGQGGATLVEATPSGVKSLLGALKRGEMVAMLADQQPKAAGKHGGIFAPFFGYPALTMVLASRLASKTGAPVLFWYMERLPQAAGFRMNWFAAPEAIYDKDQERSVAALNLGLEQCILHRPDQYLWTYKRFDRQPEGRRSPYKPPLPVNAE